MMDWIPLVLIVFKLIVFGTCMFFAVKWHHDKGKKEKEEQRLKALKEAKAQEASAAQAPTE